METVTLDFLAKQNERIISDMAGLRDDMAVMMAIVLRLDGTMNAMQAELRATHAQISRMNDRVRKLEAGA